MMGLNKNLIKRKKKSKLCYVMNELFEINQIT